MNAQILIVGAGAAGMFAAAVVAETAPECDVLVLEKGPHPLDKVRRSGGGRCNLTHARTLHSVLIDRIRVFFYPHALHTPCIVCGVCA